MLIAALYLLRHTRFKQYFGIWSMVLLYLFCAIRMFLPLEFPHTLIAADGTVYPHIYDLLMQERELLADKPIALALSLIWLIGFCGLLVRYTRQYRRAICSIERYAEPFDAQMNALLKTVQRQTGRIIKVQGYTAPNLESAFGVGVLRKQIVLPDRSYTAAELHYILLHEYTHFLNRDTVVKLMVTLFCMIFWWNPVAYLLRKDLEQTLEIKCDISVAGTLSSKERAAYLRTILSLMKQADRKRRIPFAATALFQSDSQTEIKERFNVVMAYSPNRHYRTANAVLVGTFALLLIASYAVLPQPKFDAPVSTEPNTVDFDSSNAYIKQNREGDYWLCIQNEQPIKLRSRDEADFYQMTGLKIVKE